MKELFLDAEIEIVLFPETDILTLSGIGGLEDETPWDIFDLTP